MRANPPTHQNSIDFDHIGSTGKMQAETMEPVECNSND